MSEWLKKDGISLLLAGCRNGSERTANCCSWQDVGIAEQERLLLIYVHTYRLDRYRNDKSWQPTAVVQYEAGYRTGSSNVGNLTAAPGRPQDWPHNTQDNTKQLGSFCRQRMRIQKDKGIAQVGKTTPSTM